MKAVLRGVEREFAASNRRMANEKQRTDRVAAKPASTMARATRQLDRQRSQALFADFRRQERERIASERRVALATRSLDRQRSTALMAQFREQERAAKRLEQAREQAQRRSDAIRTSNRRAMASGLARGVSGAIGTTTRVAGAGAAIVGGFAAAEAIREESAIRRSASQLANQAGDPKIKGELARESRGVRGFTGEEALAGMSEFVTKTGDLDTARKMIGSLGELALATGSDLGDLGATAGQAFNVLRDQIDDPVQRLEELKSLMGALAQQGALGAVEIRDLARDFGKLGAATRGFEGGAPDLLRTMGAFAQIAVARGGAESSADASTAASRLVNDIVTNRKKFSRLGVGIQSKSEPTKLRDPAEIMMDVLEKTGGDVTKTAGLFGMESQKIFKGLGATFSEAEKKKKGSGRGAVEAELARFSGAKLSPEEIASRAESRLADPDLQFAENTKKFNLAISRDLMPAITSLIPELVKLTPIVSELVKAVAKAIAFFGGPAYVDPDADPNAQPVMTAEGTKAGSEITASTLGESALMGPVRGAQAIGDTVSAMWKHGTLNPFSDAVDQELKKKQDGRKLQPPGVGSPGTTPGVNPSSPGAPNAANATPAQGPAAQQGVTSAKDAADLKGAAAALKDAAETIKRNGGQPDASRSAPILSPSRG